MMRFLCVALFLCVVSGDVGGYFLEADQDRRSDSSSSTPSMQKLAVGTNVDHPDRLPTWRIMEAEEAKWEMPEAKWEMPDAKRPDAKTVIKEKKVGKGKKTEKGTKAKKEERAEKQRVKAGSKDKKESKKSEKKEEKESEKKEEKESEKKEEKESEKKEEKETDKNETTETKKSNGAPPVVIVNNLSPDLFRPITAVSAETDEEEEEEEEDHPEPSWASNNKPLIGCAAAGISIIVLLFGLKVMRRCRRTTKPMAYKDLRNDDDEFFQQEDDEACDEGLYTTTYAHNDEDDSRDVFYSSQKSLKQRNHVGSVLDLEDEPQDEGHEEDGGKKQNLEGSCEVGRPASSGDANYLTAFR